MTTTEPAPDLFDRFEAIPDEASDPNEIVVAGGKAKMEPRLSIGTASLKRCSSLSFDREAEVIRLSCKLD